MRTTLCLSALALCVAASLKATTWHVGASQTYTKPSQVSGLVSSGDTVDIDAGIYTADVCAWTANNLLIRGKNGMAHLKANGSSYGDKAIWVIQGMNTTIEHIEFSLCTSTADNGAGIRQEGKNLIVRYCNFHENENGILSTALAGSKITVEYSEFNLNGAGDGYSHNVYIGKVDTLLFRYNYSHHADKGHELKSRANVNYILYNRFGNEATGTASYEIDLPNGGLAVVMGNSVQQGLSGDNSTLIAYGMEGLSNTAPHNFYLINNTVVNEKNTGNFVNVKTGTALYKSYNNLFAGNGTVLNGGATTVDTVGNKRTAIAAAGFINSVVYDYHLTAGSPAINAGAAAGVASSGLSLSPAWEYTHPAAQSPRVMSGAPDAGAYEFALTVSIKTQGAEKPVVLAYTQQGQLTLQSDTELSWAGIIDLEGKLVYESSRPFSTASVAVNQWPAGVYILRAVSKSGAATTKKLILP